MSENTAIIRFKTDKINKDLDIPLYISANELVFALNNAFHLGIDLTNVRRCYLKSENPTAFLRGNKTLGEFGIRNGSIIYYVE